VLTTSLVFLLLYILFPNLRRKLSLLDVLGEFLEHVLQMIKRSSHQSSDRFKGWFIRCTRMRLSWNKHLRSSKTLRHTFGFRGIQRLFQFRQIIVLQIKKSQLERTSSSSMCSLRFFINFSRSGSNSLLLTFIS
jgi:hypothetical protein